MADMRQDEYSVEHLIVTPEMATDWLTHNVDNRPVVQKNVSNLARQMAEGLWRRNGTSIVFDTKGRLIDGQHRLWACFQSGVAFETLIVRGVNREAQDTIDIGSRRTVGQTLGMGPRKIDNARAAAGVIQAVFALAHHESAISVSTSETRRFYIAHPSVAAVVKALYGIDPGMRPKWIGAIYVIAKDYLNRSGRGKAFVDVFMTGEPDYPGCPALMAREAILRAHSRPSMKLATSAYLSTITKAFNLFATRSTVERIRVNDDYGIDGFDTDVLRRKFTAEGD